MIASAKSRRIVAAVGAVLLVLFGIVIGRAGAPADPAPAPVSRSASDSAGTVTAGPEDVAVEWARWMSTWPYLTPEKFEVQLDERLAADAAKERERDLVWLEKNQKLLGAASTDVWWVVAPLATRVVDQGKDRASVTVWALSLKSAGGVWAPVGGYMVLDLELVLEDGGWRVFSALGTDGPAPLPAVSNVPVDDSAQFAEALAGFTPVETGR